ncbi:MAG: peptide chain release factor N(5)-glutamine methyltransferase [Burkholderiaceae bacterium]|nr:peptide chain release factor N(5)-glutamine methyltransferase [Burkholderiaceae bacterium]
MPETGHATTGSAAPVLKTPQELLAASQLPRHEAWPLLEAASGRSREFMIAHGDKATDPGATALFERMASLRRDGVPVAYLTGWREFYGRAFWVNRHTLIPRMETELLIESALAYADRSHQPIRLCDLGTGSGCIAITLALELKGSEITATDASVKALEMARNNAAWLGVGERIKFREGRWFEALTGLTQRFHGLVSNPPYVAAGDPHLQLGDLRFEPRSALTPMKDAPGDQSADAGLSDIAEIARGAGQWLEPHGFLLVEHGFEQQDAVIALLDQAGFEAIRGISDQAGLPRAVMGFWPG